MINIGLKLWSTNLAYTKDILRFYDEGVFQYIELYAYPDTFEETSKYWKKFKIPFIIHAPHFLANMCLSCKGRYQSNIRLAESAFKFADILQSDKIIFHLGINGELDEAIRQINLINDKRIVVENKPYYALKDLGVCNGTTPEEIEKVIIETGAGFCLDFGHAICAANAKKMDQIEYIKQFQKLKPDLYHLTDGDFKSEFDSHLHLGEGDFPLSDLKKMMPAGSFLTVETLKNSKNRLDDFQQDVSMFFRNS